MTDELSMAWERLQKAEAHLAKMSPNPRTLDDAIAYEKALEDTGRAKTTFREVIRRRRQQDETIRFAAPTPPLCVCGEELSDGAEACDRCAKHAAILAERMP